MAIPNDNYGLVAVVTEIDKFGEIILKDQGTGGSLVNAFAAASEDGFVGAGRDSLLDFAGYEQPDPTPPPVQTPTINYVGYYPSDSSNACSNFSFNTLTTIYLYEEYGSFYEFGAEIFSSNPYNSPQNLPYAPAGYYAADFGWKYWNGTSFTSEGSCDTGGGGFGF